MIHEPRRRGTQSSTTLSKEPSPRATRRRRHRRAGPGKAADGADGCALSLSGRRRSPS
jgi:hypothetical protein